VDQTLVTAEERELDKAVVVAADHDSVETPTTTAEVRELDLAKGVLGVVAARRAATEIRSAKETLSPEELRELDEARAVFGFAAARRVVEEAPAAAEDRELDRAGDGVVAALHDSVETPTITAEVRELDQARAVLGVVAARRAAEKTLAAAEIPFSKEQCELVDQAPAVLGVVGARSAEEETPSPEEQRELDEARAIVSVVAARRATEIGSTGNTPSPEEQRDLYQARAVLCVVAARGAVDQTLVTAEERELDKAVVVAAHHDSVETPTTTAKVRELDLARAVLGVVAARRAVEETPVTADGGELVQERAVLGVVAARDGAVADVVVDGRTAVEAPTAAEVPIGLEEEMQKMSRSVTAVQDDQAHEVSRAKAVLTMLDQMKNAGQKNILNDVMSLIGKETVSEAADEVAISAVLDPVKNTETNNFSSFTPLFEQESVPETTDEAICAAQYRLRNGGTNNFSSFLSLDEEILHGAGDEAGDHETGSFTSFSSFESCLDDDSADHLHGHRYHHHYHHVEASAVGPTKMKENHHVLIKGK